jgi:hypothetical protein
MGHWEFNSSDPSSVRVDVTQRDQFNNDEVGLADALVREVIQNSSDARAGLEPVKVRFAIRTVSGSDAQFMAQQISPLLPHLKACSVDAEPVDESSFRILAIEDFNTKGLTGAFDDIDDDNFDSFWRAVGKSEKSGKSGGRWGLGKLVYSSSSKIRVFFGLTIRKGDAGAALMGQAVLKNHRLGDSRYPAHGFWFDKRTPQRMQLPVQDEAEIGKFSKLAGLSRTDQTGLSIIIPYLVDSVDDESLISGVISNYYFPILAGRLVVEVGDVLISKDTFLEVAQDFGISDHIPFGFVKQISDTIEKTPDIVSKLAVGNAELGDSFFDQEQTAKMKEAFAGGELVHVRVPVILKPKDEPDVRSFIDLYLRALPEGTKPFSLFARGPITLPGERKHFGSAAAYGALIANDDLVSSFLGDAENPAHTAWNPMAEKLAPHWRSPQGTLASIRHSLRNLYTLIADQAETEDAEALIDFFSILEKSQATKGKRKRTPKPKIDVKPREKAISIKRRAGGFQIVAGPGAAAWTYPRIIRLRMAYDMIGANPFNRHSPYDFDLQNGGDIEVEASNATAEALKANVLKVTATAPDFLVQVSGFDERRDIVVDARAL